MVYKFLTISTKEIGTAIIIYITLRVNFDFVILEDMLSISQLESRETEL